MTDSISTDFRDSFKDPFQTKREEPLNDKLLRDSLPELPFKMETPSNNQVVEQFRRNSVTGKYDEPATTAETLALADLGPTTGLDQLRQLTRPQIESKLSAATKLLLGKDPEFILENAWGDKRREDEKGAITSFTYVDRVGNETHKVDHIIRDGQGKIISFNDSKGRRWENLRPDFYFDADAPPMDRNQWVHFNRQTNQRSSLTYDLGSITIDKEGVHASGTNPAALNIPPRQRTTVRGGR